MIKLVAIWIGWTVSLISTGSTTVASLIVYDDEVMTETVKVNHHSLDLLCCNIILVIASVSLKRFDEEV